MRADLRYGSLFSGYLGLDLGVQSVPGGTTAWVSDIDPGACRILAHRAPDAPNLGDITTVDWSTVEPVDALTGGFPCQDVSHAGRRAGLIRDGEGRTRSGLWGHMLRAINTLRPSLVVAENVRGLLSATADSDVEPCPFCMGDDREPPMRALGAVLADLADVGYDAWWVGLRAADVGAAHGRFRVFIFAAPADVGAGGLSVLRPDARAGDGMPPAGVSGDGVGSVTLLPTPAVNDMGEGKTVEHWDEWTAKMQAAHGNGNGHGKSLAIEAQRLLPTPVTEPDTGNGHARNLGREARLLPTPVADNSRGLPSAGTDYQSLPNAVALLPTPMTTDGGSNSPGDRARNAPGLRTIPNLLPTPRATDGSKGGPNQRGSSGDLMLPSAVNLLQTPSVADAMGGHLSRSGSRSDEPLLPGQAKAMHGQRWGDYAHAIARWEALTRPAPDPTKPGPKGGPRLSAAFVEWLMGLPAGWITDPAIWDGMTTSAARNAQLKAAGNGVVPAQAAAATRWFIDQIRLEDTA